MNRMSLDKEEAETLYNRHMSETCRSLLEFNSEMKVLCDPTSASKTNIVCTIGPACCKPEVLRELMINGMSIARLNFSHGNHEYFENLIKTIREVSKDSEIYPKCVAIALDTKGPEIRTGNNLDNKPITLTTGSVVLLTHNPEYKEKGTSKAIYVDYPHLYSSCSLGTTILLADGSVQLSVQSKTEDVGVYCLVVCGATFGSRKNICIPGVPVNLPSLAQKDIEDIKFGVKNEVDIIFASFIRCAENVMDIRNLLKSLGKGEDIKIISKIENFEGVRNIDEIIRASDGIMVARGDLGMDLPLPKVVGAQKMIVAKCNLANKPVICATQMMESMIVNSRPTRAEVSDIGNAVMDGADCVMLSGETANGSFPVGACSYMREVCRMCESILYLKSLHETLHDYSNWDSHESMAISMAASFTASKLKSSLIICFSTSGKTAQLISKFRPNCKILTLTRNVKVARQLNLYRGVHALLYDKPSIDDWVQDVDDRLHFATHYALHNGLIVPDSVIVFVCGWQKGPGYSNTMRILHVGSDDTIQGMNNMIKQSSIKK